MGVSVYGRSALGCIDADWDFEFCYEEERIFMIELFLSNIEKRIFNTKSAFSLINMQSEPLKWRPKSLHASFLRPLSKVSGRGPSPSRRLRCARRRWGRRCLRNQLFCRLLLLLKFKETQNLESTNRQISPACKRPLLIFFVFRWDWTTHWIEFDALIYSYNQERTCQNCNQLCSQHNDRPL